MINKYNNDYHLRNFIMDYMLLQNSENEKYFIEDKTFMDNIYAILNKGHLITRIIGIGTNKLPSEAAIETILTNENKTWQMSVNIIQFLTMYFSITIEDKSIDKIKQFELEVCRSINALCATNRITDTNSIIDFIEKHMVVLKVFAIQELPHIWNWLIKHYSDFSNFMDKDKK